MMDFTSTESLASRLWDAMPNLPVRLQQHAEALAFYPEHSDGKPYTAAQRTKVAQLISIAQRRYWMHFAEAD